MDGRIEGRFPVKFDVTITDLERRVPAACPPIPGHVVDISGNGICLILPVEFAAGHILRLEVAGSSLFGHVVYSNAHGTEFHTGIEITRVLFGENDLSKLLQAVLQAQTTPSAVREEVAREES
jgi:hypothetical protein